MGSEYKVYRPEHYPVAWMTGLKIALKAKEEENPWVSVDWARGEYGAINRLKRLRAFRKGVEAHKDDYTGFAEAFEQGFLISFRKQAVRGVWDVQLAWTMKVNKEELLAIVAKALGKDYNKKS